MAEKLVIVESPTKARTIGRMLGSGYQIMASVGHIRDLPQNSFGVDIENDFTPLYQENPGSGKIIKELRAAAKKASDVYLAPDPDREGEAIAEAHEGGAGRAEPALQMLLQRRARVLAKGCEDGDRDPEFHGKWA